MFKDEQHTVEFAGFAPLPPVARPGQQRLSAVRADAMPTLPTIPQRRRGAPSAPQPVRLAAIFTRDGLRGAIAAGLAGLGGFQLTEFTGAGIAATPNAAGFVLLAAGAFLYITTDRKLTGGVGAIAAAAAGAFFMSGGDFNAALASVQSAIGPLGQDVGAFASALFQPAP